MFRLFKKRVRCPECNGRAEIIADMGDVIAVQCLQGHWRPTRKEGKTLRKKIYPVILLPKEVNV